MTLTKTLIIPDHDHKIESNNCSIIHCFEEYNPAKTSCRIELSLTLLLEIMHCARKLQISQFSAGK